MEKRVSPDAGRAHRSVPVHTALLLLLFSLLLGGCAILPKAMDDGEILAKAEEDLAQFFKEQEPLDGPLQLHDAMARAIRYNMEHQVKMYEEAVAQAALNRGRLDMLPQLIASAGYARRSNENGSVSKSLLTGQQSLEASTSQDRDQINADVIGVWNLLDFGVSYTQAQQQADEVLIAREMRRRSIQNIIQNVRGAYYRAASAELILPEADQLLGEVEKALRQSRAAEKNQAGAPMKFLDYQQELLDTVQQLWTMRRDLTLARTELANLIGLRPGEKYATALMTGTFPAPPEFTIDMATMESLALTNRSELRSEFYQGRISALEVRKALLRMLPGLELNVNANYDANSFLVNNSWAQAGLRLSWGIFNIFTGPAAMEHAELQKLVVEKRRLAVALMVLAQAHLAQERLYLSRRSHEIAGELATVMQRKLHHVLASRQASTGTELDEIRMRAAALAARVRQGLTYAELQEAVGRIFHSAGLDPFPPAVENQKLPEFSRSIEKYETELLALFSREPAGMGKGGKQ